MFALTDTTVTVKNFIMQQANVCMYFIQQAKDKVH
jgi:hypothetical protein